MYINDFFQLWIKLYSFSGCMNYIHLLSSGHVAEYMFRRWNLHLFSQQGWEHFNFLLKVIFLEELHMEAMQGEVKPKIFQPQLRTTSAL